MSDTNDYSRFFDAFSYVFIGIGLGVDGFKTGKNMPKKRLLQYFGTTLSSIRMKILDNI